MEFNRFSIILSFALLSACGGADLVDSDNDSPTENPNTALSLADTTWLADCRFFANSDPNDPDLSTNQTSTLVFSEGENEVTITVDIYEADNNTCSGNPFYSPMATYLLGIGESVTTATGLTAFEWDAVLLEETPTGAWSDGFYTIIYREGNALYLGEEQENALERTDELVLETPFTLVL